jgi:hypothetical protein
MAVVSAEVAHAQRPADAKIYIDPRLLPQRQQMSREQDNPYVGPAIKQRAHEAYYNRYQPIQIPFRNGTVPISPHDPCKLMLDVRGVISARRFR